MHPLNLVFMLFFSMLKITKFKNHLNALIYLLPILITIFYVRKYAQENPLIHYHWLKKLIKTKKS